MKKEFEVSYRYYRILIRHKNRGYTKELQFERLLEHKNYYRLARKWICPECGKPLDYQETGGCMADGDFEEWLECVGCEYSRDLNSDDMDLVYGFR